MQKARFVWRVLQLLLKIGQIVAEARDLYDIFIDRGYGVGETAITDNDLQVSLPSEGIDLTGFKTANFGEVATVLVDLIQFMDGTGAPVQKDRGAIYNKYRRDV